MARTIRTLLLSFLALSPALLHAQTAAISAPSPHREQPVAAVNITFGQSAYPLNGPWKFSVGDSPIDPKTGKPLWSESEFDDTAWETVDLTPKEGVTDPANGLSGYVPGWTARGHAGYSGYAWYRIRVKCQSTNGSALALAGPADVDDAYQIFSSGRLIGGFGDFSGARPASFVTRPIEVALSGSCAQTGVTQVLAFRFWMDRATLMNEPDAGGMHNAPLLGEASVIGLRFQAQWLEVIRGYLIISAEVVVFALLAIIAFSLILFDRSDPVYLWIGLLFVVWVVLNSWLVVSTYTQWIPLQPYFAGSDALVAVNYAMWVMVWWVWFGREGKRWLPWVLSAVAILFTIAHILGQETFPGLVSHASAAWFYSLTSGLRFVFFGLLIWIVIDGIRSKGLDGWLVLPLVVLRGVGMFESDLIRLHLFRNWFPFGLQIAPVDIAIFLTAAVMALLLMRRLLKSVKRQREMALDFKQAQEVQQVILPERRIALPGFIVETEYRPATEVGGDFYQIIPHLADGSDLAGSLLIVAGDVAGHGLKAGMLVALLVGAIRMAVEVNSDPDFVLRALNRRLMGRSDSTATCLAMRISAGGEVTLANSGHLPPYLNGQPVAMEGALPLGMIEGAEPSLTHFELKPDDRLVLMSDGIVEATDADGQLFGFDRIHALLGSPSSATQLADAAQSFGQQDDISVISITRISATAPALA